MEALIIGGGKPLQGTVSVCGAKNAVLPVMAAAVAHGGTYILHNCPDITDVSIAGEIIRHLGGQVLRQEQTLWVDTANVCRWQIPAALMARMRASVLFLGALLARFGRAVLTMPGGCPLGRRPIDLHLEALAQMGAGVCLYENEIRCEAARLHGCVIELPFPSVGATENALVAATACHGTVRILGAAREPEVVDLVRFLRSSGAEITGEGTAELTVHGGAAMGNTTHTVLPDRIETATLLCAAAGCGGEIVLQKTDGALLPPVVEALEQAGCQVVCAAGEIRLSSSGELQACGSLETAPYPGFPTDAQALVMAAMLRAKGSVRFSESVFERRFGHVPQLRKFGACIETAGSTALVQGVPKLHAAQAEGVDLRAAAALVIAALQAEGKSVITGLKHLDRGYDNLEGKLRLLGADICRADLSTL